MTDDIKNQILRIINNKNNQNSELLIVDKNIINELIELIPEESLKAYIMRQIEATPSVNSIEFQIWVSEKRRSTGLSQRLFAKKIRDYGIRIHGSDIGNIESGKRLDNYTPERLEKIKQGILKYTNPISH